MEYDPLDSISIDTPRPIESSQANTYLARIRFSIPWMNIYIVQPFHYSVKHPNIRPVSGPIGEGGGSTREVFGVGDCVVVIDDTTNSHAFSATGHIISKISNLQLDESKFAEVSVNGKNIITDFIHTLVDRFKAWLPIGFWPSLDRHNDSPIDVLPKDVVTHTPTGPGVSCLKTTARVQASDVCGLELDNILKRERLEAYQKQWFSPLHDWTNGMEGITLNRTEFTALTKTEGSYQFTEDSDSTNDIYPVYRDHTIDGDLVSGWSTCKYIPDSENISADLVEREYTSYSGSKETKSAKGFIWSKTPDIKSPYQIEEYDGILTYLEEVQEFSPTYESIQTESPENVLRDRSLNMTTEKAYSVNYFDRQRYNDELWGISSTKQSEGVASAVDAVSTRKLNKTTENMYGLPESFELNDPHTGRTYTYYKSESFIRMDDDGSVVLTDGYGSEIRMQRGKIILSCPLDVEIRPGRDLHTMAGRHTALVSQKDAILHSSKGNTYVKAQNDLELLGGANREGKVIIDSRGASGALIRSMYTLNIAGQDIFMGTIYSNGINDEANTVTRCESGRIIIDGGSNLLLRGNISALVGRNVNVTSMMGDTIDSAIMLTGTQITVLSTSTGFTGSAHWGYLTSIVSIQIGDKKYFFSSNSDSPSVQISGSLAVTKYIMAEGVASKRMQAEVGVFSNADRRTGMSAPVRVDTVESSNIGMNHSDPMFSISYTGAYQDSHIAYEFRYKNSNELNIQISGYVMPGMLWQEMMATESNWEEPELQSIVKDKESTMVYPGKEVWQDGFVSKSGYSLSILGKGYRIHG